MLNFVKIISLFPFVLILPGLVFMAPFIGATGALYLIGFEYPDHTTIMTGAFIFGLLSFHLYFYLFLAPFLFIISVFYYSNFPVWISAPVAIASYLSLLVIAHSARLSDLYYKLKATCELGRRK